MDLEDVLLTEAYSEIDRRKSLASSTVEDASPSTWWQSGYIRTHDGWVNYEDAVRHFRGRPEQTEYRRLSEIAPPGVKGHLLLAKWCLRNERIDQYRAHMQAAMKTDPSLQTAQNFERMGFSQLGNTWLSPESAYKLAKRRIAIDSSLTEWGQICQDIQVSLGGSHAESAQAIQRLEEIESPEAILAIDHLLGKGDATCHRLAVQAFARVDSVQATQSLAKYAIFSPYGTARDAAITTLKDRRKEDFFPAALGLLATDATVAANRPIHSSLLQAYRTRRMTLGITPIPFFIKVSRKTQRHTDILFDSETQLAFETFRGWDPTRSDLRTSGGSATQFGSDRFARLVDVHMRRVEAAVRLTGHLNVETFERNSRVFPLLHGVTNETSSEPEFWWDWWDVYTDVDTPTREVREVTEVVQFRERNQVRFTIALSCFGAGTQVLSATGPRAIETLKIGDRVLSQDIDTGELRFRVIERTTVRPPHASMNIAFGSESIRCTGGHNFWKAGEGWVKARDLETGDRIRTPTGTVAVTGTTDARPTKTYNLVVEGFHTYFVGKSALLVQDVLPPAATDMVLPGLSRFELAE